MDDLLDLAGAAHATSCVNWHGKALRFLGVTLADFLMSLESLHVVLQRAGIGLRDGLVCCVREEHGRLVFQCRSSGLLGLLPGLFRQLSAELFQTNVRVSVAGLKLRQATLVVQPEPGPTPPPGRALGSNSPEDLAVSVFTFCRAFPFHFMCDRHLRLTQMGRGLARIFGGRGNTVPALFVFLQPKLEMRFDHVVASINLPFLLQVRDDAIKHERYKVIGCTQS